MRREILEKLDALVMVEDYIIIVEYDYPSFHLSMDCFWCKVQAGNLILKEHEAARWLGRDELKTVDWLPTDMELIQIMEESGRI